MAQVPQNNVGSEMLKDKVKRVRYNIGEISYDVRELKKKNFNQTNYHVDSFTNFGLKIASYKVKNGVVTEHTEFVYDKNRKLIEAYQIYDQDGVRTHESFTYDLEENIIFKKSYDYRGVPVRLIKYFYTDGQIVTKEDSINGGIEKTTYRYANKIKVEDTIYHRSEGKTIHRYDDKGNNVSTIFISNSSYVEVVSKYDDNNNRIEQQYQKADGTIMSIFFTQYTYDFRGNWTRRIEEVPNDVGDIEIMYQLTLREIEYY